MAEARNWTPQQVGKLTLRQMGILTMKPDGIGGAECFGVEPVTKSGRKVIEPMAEKAIENLKLGLRWDS